MSRYGLALFIAFVEVITFTCIHTLDLTCEISQKKNKNLRGGRALNGKTTHMSFDNDFFFVFWLNSIIHFYLSSLDLSWL